MRTPLFLAIALFSTQALAVECNFNLEASPVEALHFAYNAETTASCELGQRFIDGLKSVATWTGVQPKVHLLAKAQGDGASFDGGSIVTTPFSFVIRGEYGNDYYVPFHYTLSILTHEYGHAIFEEQAGAKIPAYTFVNSQRKLMSARELELLSQGQRDPMKDPLYKQMSDSLMQNKDIVRLWVMVSGYSEFIADVVAVFHADDKAEMFESMLPPHANQATINWLDARNFATEHAADTWTDSEPHGLLAPVRSYVGSKMWPKTKRQKARYLDRLIQASIAEINQRIDAKELTLSPSEINRRLITRLEQSQL